MQRVYMNRAYTDPKGDGGSEQYHKGGTYPVSDDKAALLRKSGAAQVVKAAEKKKPKASKRPTTVDPVAVANKQEK